MALPDAVGHAANVLGIIPAIRSLYGWFAGRPEEAQRDISSAITKLRQGYDVLLKHVASVASLSVDNELAIRETRAYLAMRAETAVELQQAEIQCAAALQAFEDHGLLKASVGFLDATKAELFRSHLVQLSQSDGSFTDAAGELAFRIEEAGKQLEPLLASDPPSALDRRAAANILGPLSRSLEDPQKQLVAAMGELRMLESEFAKTVKRPATIIDRHDS